MCVKKAYRKGFTDGCVATFKDTKCHKCGNIDNLVMASHRNENNNIVGWVFACQECFPSLAGKSLNISLYS